MLRGIGDDACVQGVESFKKWHFRGVDAQREESLS